MKASYKTQAIAKAQATARTKKTGEDHVFYGNEDGTEFFVITKAEQEAAIAAALAAAEADKAAEAAAEETAAVTTTVTPIRAKKTSAHPGLTSASWKWILEHLPEGEIEDVAVRHSNGKRYNLKVNGQQVWYSFTEEGANAAKAAVLALAAAK